MAMTPLRSTTCLAIDGGGVKGYIIAKALEALELELGGGPLINAPQIKVLAGTSTGAVIASAIALGMQAKDIAQLYIDLGNEVFPPLLPPEFPEALQELVQAGEALLKPAVYSNDKFIELLRSVIMKCTGSPDFTLGDLNAQLGPDKTLVITTVSITERRTVFLKSSSSGDADWPLWRAILASSSAPLALPVVEVVDESGKIAYYVDGGVGNFGNPAFVAATEAIKFRHHRPKEVTVLSFGTGWVYDTSYVAAYGAPSEWHAIKWGFNTPLIMLGDASRSQSVDVIENLGGRKLDFRRFQFGLDRDIPSDAYSSPDTYTYMEQLGVTLGRQISQNHYAPKNAKYDPEGLRQNLQAYRKSRAKPQSTAGSKAVPINDGAAAQAESFLG